MDWLRKGIWQGVEKGSEIETAPVWCCWENVQMDWIVHAQQKSKSPVKATPEQKREPSGKASHKVEWCPLLCSSSSSVTSCIECPRTYKEPSTQTTLRYGAVKNASPLQTIGCNKHSKWSSRGPDHGLSKWTERKQLSRSSASPTRSTVCT